MDPITKTSDPIKTVLVIEDDPNTMVLVALYLEREGFRPITAADGRTQREKVDIKRMII